MNGPHRLLTQREESIVSLVAKGYALKRIAHELGLQPSYVRQRLYIIADLLPNPDRLTPYRLVLLWATKRAA